MAVANAPGLTPCPMTDSSVAIFQHSISVLSDLAVIEIAKGFIGGLN